MTRKILVLAALVTKLSLAQLIGPGTGGGTSTEGGGGGGTTLPPNVTNAALTNDGTTLSWSRFVKSLGITSGLTIGCTDGVDSASGNCVLGVNFALFPSLTSANSFSGVQTFSNVRIDTPSTVQSITGPTVAVACNATNVQINPTSNYTTTAAPTIANGTEGQLCNITNTSASTTLTIQSQPTLANSNLVLNTATVALGPGQMIQLRYVNGDWREIRNSTVSTTFATQAECEAMTETAKTASPACIFYALNGGALDTTYADYSAPFRTETSEPATCTVDQWYWNTTTKLVKYCSAPNVWTIYPTIPTNVAQTLKCTSGTTVTGVTVAAPIGSYTFPSGLLAAGDVVKILALFVHGPGANAVLDTLPRITLTFGGTSASEWTYAATSETYVQSIQTIYITGMSNQTMIQQNLRAGGQIIGAGSMTALAESITSPTFTISGRSSNTVNDDTLSLAHYCIELVKGVL